MIRFFRYFVIFLGLLIAGNSFSQDYKNEKQLIKGAEDAFKDADYKTALPLYSTLISNYPKDPNYNYRYGACLMFTGSDKEKPVRYLQYAASKPDVDPLAYYYYGMILHLNYEFKQAIKYYKKFKDQGKLSEIKTEDPANLIRQCENGQTLLKTITDLIVLDKKQLHDEDFYKVYDLTEFGGQILVKPEDFKSEYDKKEDVKSIFYFPKDADKIFFSSHSPDNKDGKDIYYAVRNEDRSWSKPVNMGSPINTPYDEDFPFLHPDGQLLYFASKGHNSLGGYDIFVSKFDSTNGSWSKPQNLDFAINTPADDYLFITDRAGESAYFSSNRETPLGEVSVYQINMERIPLDFAFVYGTFLSDNTKKASIKIQDVETQAIIGEYNTDENGKYKIKLPNDGKFNFIVDYENSTVTHSGVVELKDQNTFKPLKQEMLVMEQGTENEKLVIKNLVDEEVEEAASPITADFLKQKAKLEINKDKFKDRKKKKKDEEPVLAQADTSGPEVQTIVDAGKAGTHIGDELVIEEPVSGDGPNLAIGENTPAAGSAAAAVPLVLGAQPSDEEVKQVAANNVNALKNDATIYAKHADKANELATTKNAEADKLRIQAGDYMSKVDKTQESFELSPEYQKAQELFYAADLLDTEAAKAKELKAKFNSASQTSSSAASSAEVTAKQLDEGSLSGEAGVTAFNEMRSTTKDATKDNLDIDLQRKELDQKLQEKRVEAQNARAQALAMHEEIDELKDDIYTKEKELETARGSRARELKEQLERDRRDLVQESANVKGADQKASGLEKELATIQSEINIIDQVRYEVAKDPEIAALEGPKTIEVPDASEVQPATSAMDLAVKAQAENPAMAMSSLEEGDQAMGNELVENNGQTTQANTQSSNAVEPVGASQNDLSSSADEDNLSPETPTSNSGSSTNSGNATASGASTGVGSTSGVSSGGAGVAAAGVGVAAAVGNTSGKSDRPEGSISDGEGGTVSGISTETPEVNAIATLEFDKDTADMNADERGLLPLETTPASGFHAQSSLNHLSDGEQDVASIQKYGYSQEYLNEFFEVAETEDDYEKAVKTYVLNESWVMDVEKEIQYLNSIEDQIPPAQYSNYNQRINSLEELKDIKLRNLEQSRAQVLTMAAEQGKNPAEIANAYRADLNTRLNLSEAEGGLAKAEDLDHTPSESSSRELSQQEIDNAVASGEAKREQAEELADASSGASPIEPEAGTEATASGEVASSGASATPSGSTGTSSGSVTAPRASSPNGNATVGAAAAGVAGAVASSGSGSQSGSDQSTSQDSNGSQGSSALEPPTGATSNVSNGTIESQSAPNGGSDDLAQETTDDTGDFESGSSSGVSSTDGAGVQSQGQESPSGSVNTGTNNTSGSVTSSTEGAAGANSGAGATSAAGAGAVAGVGITAVNASSTSSSGGEPEDTTRAGTAQLERNRYLSNGSTAAIVTGGATVQEQQLSRYEAPEKPVEAIVEEHSEDADNGVTYADAQVVEVESTLASKKAEMEGAKKKQRKAMAPEVEELETQLELKQKQKELAEYRKEALARAADVILVSSPGDETESEKERKRAERLQMEADDMKYSADEMEKEEVKGKKKRLAKEAEVKQLRKEASKIEMEAGASRLLAEEMAKLEADVMYAYKNTPEELPASDKPVSQADVESVKASPEFAAFEELRKASVKEYQEAEVLYSQADEVDAEIALEKEKVLEMKHQASIQIDFEKGQVMMDSANLYLEDVKKKESVSDSLRVEAKKHNTEGNHLRNQAIRKVKSASPENSENLVAYVNMLENSGAYAVGPVGTSPSGSDLALAAAAGAGVAGAQSGDREGFTPNEFSRVVKGIDEYPEQLTDAIFQMIEFNESLYNDENPIPVDSKMPDGVVYKVQIGAFRNPPPPDVFKGFAPVRGETTRPGWMRYTAGLFTDSDQARLKRNEIRALGYEDAFIVAYRNGERISLEDAAASTGTTASAITAGPASPSGSTTSAQGGQGSSRPTGGVAEVKKLDEIQGLLYTVQVGAYNAPINASQVYDISPLVEYQQGGLYKYGSGIYNDPTKAGQAKDNIVGLGYGDAFVTAFYNGKRVSMDEANTIAQQGAGVFAQEAPSAAQGVSAGPASVIFRVQIGAYREEVPVEDAQVILSLSNLGLDVQEVDGLTTYTAGNYDTYETANEFKDRVIGQGLKGAFVVAFNKGQKIDLQRAIQLSKQ